MPVKVAADGTGVNGRICGPANCRRVRLCRRTRRGRHSARTGGGDPRTTNISASFITPANVRITASGGAGRI